VVICSCFNVTDKEIEKAIRENNLATVEDVTHYTKAGGGCGGCVPQIEEILARINGRDTTPKKVASKSMTMLEKVDAVRKVLDADIRPLLQQDGGDLELVDIEGNTVFVRFTGHCKGCSFVDFTHCQVVEKKLQEKVHPDLVAKQVE
jgi:NifU-like protein